MRQWRQERDRLYIEVLSTESCLAVSFLRKRDKKETDAVETVCCLFRVAGKRQRGKRLSTDSCSGISLSPGTSNIIEYLEGLPVSRLARNGRLPCIVCGVLSQQSRCQKHRTRQARGYDQEHQTQRDLWIRKFPFCAECLHVALHYGKCPEPGCPKCPLQLDHTPSLSYIRKHPGCKITYRVLCRQCNRKKSDQ